MRRARYAPEYVRGLVEEYAALRAQADTTRRGLRYLVEMADLNRALDSLTDEEFEVVLLHGLLGLPTRVVGELLHKSHTSIARRYRDALVEVTFQINGGLE